MGLGFVAARHLDAIQHVGGNLVAAYDPHDSVGILDQYAPGCRFTTDPAEFKLWMDSAPHIDIVSMCIPNDEHYCYSVVAMNSGCAVLLEKPATIDLHLLDKLIEHSARTACDCNVVLQLRTNPALIAYRDALDGTRKQVDLAYCTPRGPWYLRSWKGDDSRSGGLAYNIGIHLFDALLWLYGGVRGIELHERTPQRMSGNLELERADVKWMLSIDPADGPCRRQMTVDGETIDLAGPWDDLHRRVYERTMAGNGFTLEDARPSIALCEQLMQIEVGIAV